MIENLRRCLHAAGKSPVMFVLAGLLTLVFSLSALPGTSQAALLDFGPIVPEVVGSTPPNIGHGYPAWFRDTNRVPLQMCLDEVGGCLFLAADRPDLTQPLAFPNLPDELFYYSATALIPNAIDDQLLFAGVEMNLADNGDGTFEQVGFSRVRIRISTLIAGDYTVTTPWKQYHFHVSQADIDATGDGRRVINATEDIGLRADGDFSGVILGNIGPYGYSQGAPFGTAPNLYLGDGTARTLVGTPNNIFRIEGPAGFPTVETDQFAVTGKLYLDPIATPITVDRATYIRNAAETRVNGFVTTQALSNQVNGALPFPQNFALTGALSALEVSGTDTPTTAMSTNDPADGKFFSDSGLFANPANLPATVSVTNTADTPVTVQSAPLVDEVTISQATYAPATRTLSVTAASGDTLTPPTLQLFFPGETLPAGALANGQISVVFPITLGAQTYEIPPPVVNVVSSIGGSDAKAVSIAVPPPPVTVNDTATVDVNGTVIINALANDTGDINPASVAIASAPASGNAVANPDGTITFTAPAVGGAVTFTYTVASNTGAVSLPATVTVTVLAPATGATLQAFPAGPQASGTQVGLIATASGGSGNYEYEFWLHDGTAWSNASPYSTSSTWTWDTTGLAAGTYTIQVNARNVGSGSAFEAFASTVYQLTAAVVAPPPATGATLTASPSAPQGVGTSVIFTATGSGGSGTYEYEFWRHDGTAWTKVQSYTSVNTFVWNTTAATGGVYTIQVNVRSAGSTAAHEAFQAVAYTLTSASAASGVTLVPDKTSPQPPSTLGGVTFTAAGQGGTGSYEYEFHIHNGVSWSQVQAYSTTATWNWDTAAATPGIYTIQVNARSLGSTAAFEAFQATAFELQ